MKSITACGFHCFTAGLPKANGVGLPEAKVVCHPPKLLDILLQEKIEWPSGMVWCVQDGDGEIKFSSDAGFRPISDITDGIWIRCYVESVNRRKGRVYKLSDDWSKAVIPYEEYKKAKELYDNQNNQFSSSDGGNSATSWFEKGELPPVDCECWYYLEARNVFIVAQHNFDDCVIFSSSRRGGELVYGFRGDFRPLKTEKEIKREKAIEDMSRIMHDKGHGSVINDVTLGALLDAGYHKD